MKKQGFLDEKDAFFSAVKSQEANLHHHNCYEILYVISGSLKLFSNDKDFLLSKGQGVILSPNFEHGFLQNDGAFLCREILMGSDIFLSATSLVSPSGKFLSTVDKNGVTFFALSPNEIEFSEYRLYEIYSYPEQNGGKGIISATCSAILGCALYPPKYSIASDNEFSKKCLSLCHSYYTNNQAHDLVRSAFDYNDVYFGRKFKECFNCTLAEYINVLRINNAVYFILNSDQPIEDICKQVGIYSTAYFIKLFKKTYGETPYKYRLSHRKKSSNKKEKLL